MMRCQSGSFKVQGVARTRMECISDVQVDKLKKYVRNGGTLYITGDAGDFTSYGRASEQKSF